MLNAAFRIFANKNGTKNVQMHFPSFRKFSSRSPQQTADDKAIKQLKKGGTIDATVIIAGENLCRKMDS